MTWVQWCLCLNLWCTVTALTQTKFSKTLLLVSPFFLTSHLGNLRCIFKIHGKLSLDFVLSHSFFLYKTCKIMLYFFFSNYFTYHDTLQCHPSCNRRQDLIFSYNLIVFYWVSISQLLYLLIRHSVLGLFLNLGCCK